MEKTLDTSSRAWAAALASTTERQIIATLDVDSHVYVAQRAKYGHGCWQDWIVSLKIAGRLEQPLPGSFKTLAAVVKYVETREADAYMLAHPIN